MVELLKKFWRWFISPEDEHVPTETRAFKTWTGDEIMHMMKLYHSNVSYDKISHVLGRSESAVIQKIRKELKKGN